MAWMFSLSGSPDGFAGSVGGPESHGCVPLSTGNAKTLFHLVEQQQGLAGFKYDTTIIVH